MQKFNLILAILFLSFHINYAQKGIINYKVEIKADVSELRQQLDTMTNATNREAQLRVISMVEETAKLEYELKFNRTKSIYKELSQAEDKSGNIGYVIITNLMKEGIFFTDVSKKQRIKQLEFLGELINVPEKYQTYKWDISNETTTIAGYSCTKASATKKIMVEEKEEEITITVWFTKEIPVPFGPRELNGLPGLVLKADLGNNLSLVTSKIKVGKKAFKGNKVKLPKGGKNISREKWDALRAERMKMFSQMM